MQPSSKYLHNEEIISTSSNVDECTKNFIHEGTEEQVDAHVILPSQKGPLLDIMPIEQNNDFQTECNQSNQDILGLLEEKSVDPLFIIDDIPSSEYLPKYDQYDDNYVLPIQDNFLEQSLAILRDEILELNLDEDFLRAFFLLLKSRKYSPKLKICVLKIISENYENEINFCILKFNHTIFEILKNSLKILFLLSKRKLYYLLTCILRMIILSNTRLKK